MTYNSLTVSSLYDQVAREFDRDRSKSLMERYYLNEVLSRLPSGASVLDLGCGSGDPIARFFLEAGCQLTGVDAAPAMIDLARSRFQKAEWLFADMRELNLGRTFDAIIAWDSFFHLSQDDQRRMFEVFQRHIAPGGLMLFTSGPAEGIAIGKLYGHELFHASLDSQEYRNLLRAHGFTVVHHRVEDPECGGHTVWLARALV